MTIILPRHKGSVIDRLLARFGVERQYTQIPGDLEKKYRPGGYFVAGRESAYQAIIRTIISCFKRKQRWRKP